MVASGRDRCAWSNGRSFRTGPPACCT